MNFDFPTFVIGFIGGTLVTGFAMCIGFIKMEIDDKRFFQGWAEGERFGRASEQARMREGEHGINDLH